MEHMQATGQHESSHSSSQVQILSMTIINKKSMAIQVPDALKPNDDNTYCMPAHQKSLPRTQLI
jgi:hypothetical protein